MVRKGIQNIDWEGHGYEFCGEAADGELAFPLIQKLRPDIVITDIKMPFMDGLELSRLIKKEFPWMEIVILSGYAQFDYAKEAISIGVAHYLTKPISAEELLREVGRIAESIGNRRAEKETQEKAELLELAGGLEKDLLTAWQNISKLRDGITSGALADAKSLASAVVKGSVSERTEGDDEAREDAAGMPGIRPGEIDRRRVDDFLRHGKRDDIAGFLDGFISDIGEGAINSLLIRQYITMDVYFACASFLSDIWDEAAEDTPPEPGFDEMAAQTLDGTVDYISELLDKVMMLRDELVNNSRGKSVVDDIKKYIDDNYGDDELTLNKIASKLGFSPGHLSMVFSRHTGTTIIKYLTDYRMNKAKELLRCTSKRSADIALDVGYKDPHYFSHIFKKTQGMTTTMYRSQKAEEEKKPDEEMG